MRIIECKLKIVGLRLDWFVVNNVERCAVFGRLFCTDCNIRLNAEFIEKHSEIPKHSVIKRKDISLVILSTNRTACGLMSR